MGMGKVGVCLYAGSQGVECLGYLLFLLCLAFIPPFQKQHPDFILGNCLSPTLGPCVTSVGKCPGQPAYFIGLATITGLGKGSIQPNIGQHWDFFFKLL